MKTINYQGKEINVQELDVLNSNERWNEYQLSDGSELAIKNILIRVFKAVDEKTPAGEPLYITNNQNIVKVKGVG